MAELSLETAEIQLHILLFHQIPSKIHGTPRLPHKGYFDAPSSAPHGMSTQELSPSRRETERLPVSKTKKPKADALGFSEGPLTREINTVKSPSRLDRGGDDLGLLGNDTLRTDHERWFNFVDLDICTKRIFRKQFIERGLIYNIALLIIRNIHHHE